MNSTKEASINDAHKIFGFFTPLAFKIYVQSGASGRSLGFEDDDLGSSPGWWAATVATYYPSRPGGATQILIFKTLRMFERPVLFVPNPFRADVIYRVDGVDVAQETERN